MDVPDQSPKRTWVAKFRDAFRGLAWAFTAESSFRVHLPFAFAVVGLAIWFGVSALEWCALLLSISTVLVAELLNSAIESLARGVGRNDPHIGRALDVASGAVLAASMFSAAVGLVIFVPCVWGILMSFGF